MITYERKNVKLTADIINDGTAATDPNIPVEATFAIAKYPNGTQDTFSFGQRSYTGVINPGQFITIDSYDSAIPAGTYKIGAQVYEPNSIRQGLLNGTIAL